MSEDSRSLGSVLALDLGTRTGWALWSGEFGAWEQGRFRSGVWSLPTRRPWPASPPWVIDDELAIREWDEHFLLLARQLRALRRQLRMEGMPLRMVVFELVTWSCGFWATQSWAGYRAMVLYTFGTSIPVYGVPVARVKKWALRGNATKAEVCAAVTRFLQARGWRQTPVTDDNEADAVAVLGAALDLPWDG